LSIVVLPAPFGTDQSMHRTRRDFHSDIADGDQPAEAP
jgi:hypothetical protein